MMGIIVVECIVALLPISGQILEEVYIFIEDDCKVSSNVYVAPMYCNQLYCDTHVL